MDSNFQNLSKQIIDNPLIIKTEISVEEFHPFFLKVENLLMKLQLSKKTFKKCYFIAIEILQNALKHGVKDNRINFRINKISNDLLILCENDVDTDKVLKLKEKLGKVNSFKTKKKLKKYYNNELLQKQLGINGTGVGLIDIKKKSGAEIIYNFDKIDNTKSLFSIITTINIEK